MGDRPGAGRRRLMIGSMLVIASTICGCAMVPPNSFIDPTKVGRFSVEAFETGVRRVLTPRETPPGLPNAEDPVPADLVPEYSEYRFVPGDNVAVTINDLLQPGVPYSAAYEVNPLGEIRVPELGVVRVAGLTEPELEEDLKARLRETGLLPDPVVVVFTQLRRGRTFSVLGSVRVAGTYPIGDPDTRLLDAIAQAGDADANARYAYVIRRPAFNAAEVLPPPPEPPSDTPAPETPDEGAEELIIPPWEPDDFDAAPNMMAQEGTGTATTAPAYEELEAVIAPPGTQPATASQPADEGAGREWPALIFDPETGAFREMPPTADEGRAADPERAAEIAAEDLLNEPFEWESDEGFAFTQRVIQIDMDDLRNGDPTQNIVVRDNDVIQIPFDTGVFYMMGEVARPGVYGFGGRDITMKQAVAISGGFTALAWPSRTEIIRHEPGTDKQITIKVNLDKIFYGWEEDFYLRDGDIVNVGTHTVAPFLFVLRNSFRFTYGFGFVYDRNFADKDAYGARPNPESLRLQRQLQRGLPF
jgi:polysaccharide export outer membrane protein